MERQSMGPLGSLQVRLLRKLWAYERATVAELVTALKGETGPPPAYVTASTVMRRLEKRGLVAREAKRRAPVYYPLVTLQAAREAQVRELVDALFLGSLPLLGTFLRGLK